MVQIIENIHVFIHISVSYLFQDEDNDVVSSPASRIWGLHIWRIWIGCGTTTQPGTVQSTNW